MAAGIPVGQLQKRSDDERSLVQSAVVACCPCLTKKDLLKTVFHFRISVPFAKISESTLDHCGVNQRLGSSNLQ